MVRRFLIVAVALFGGAAAIHFASQAAEPSKPATPAAVGELTAVEKALSQSALLKFDKTPLKDVAAALAKQYQINVLLDHKALQEASIGDNLPISFQLDGGPLRSGLRLMLRRHDLGYLTLTDDVLLLITTIESVQKHVTSRLYDVRDLVGYDVPMPYGGRAADYDSLIDAIVSFVSPASWDSMSGAAPIATILGCLIIPQTEDVHEQIAALLQALRKVHQAGPAGCEPVRVDDPDTPVAAAVQVQLDRKRDIHFKTSFLRELTAWLRHLGIPLVVEEVAAAQVGENQTFDELQLTQVPLGWALQRILSQHELGYYVAADGLVITTQQAAETRLECVVYPLTELSEQVDRSSLSYFDVLARAAVEPNSRDASMVQVVPDAGALIFEQTHDAQVRFAKLLTQLRARVKASQPALDDQTPVVKIYHLSVTTGKTMVDVSDADTQKYIAVIRNLIEPKSWSDGSGYIAAVPGAIVVRQTPAVQQRVQELLAELGAVGLGGGFQGGAFGSAPPQSSSPNRTKRKANPTSGVPDTTKISNGKIEKPQ